MQRRHKAVAAEEQSCNPYAGMLCLAQVSTCSVLPSHTSLLCWVPPLPWPLDHSLGRHPNCRARIWQKRRDRERSV